MDVFAASILFLFPFLHVNSGLDIADTTYSLLNYASFPHMNKTWAISTLLANCIGHLFTKLPFGNTMLGMNIFCMSLCGVFVIWFYFFLKKQYPAPVVFLGLLIAQGFGWCPKVILYHYLSYFLFLSGTIFLLTGIQTSKKKWYVIAGALLGLNVFVRFPNITESAMIVVLFYYGIREKRNILKEFLCCIGGYLAVFLLGVLIVSIFFGWNSYPEMIHSLFGMTKEATSYTPKSMLKTIFGDYLQYAKPLLPFLGIPVLAMPFLILFKKPLVKAVVILLMGLSFGVVMRILYYFGFFNFNFVDYRSIYMWGTFLLMTSLACGVYNLFAKSVPAPRKYLSLAVIVIILITPLGSNNGLYTVLNNLFFTAPFVIGELTFDFGKPLLAGIRENKKTKLWWGVFGFRALGLMFVTMALVTGMAFGVDFLFRDTAFVGGDFATVQNNPVIAGIRTDSKNASNLQEVNDYLEQNGLKNKEAICYGFIPGIFYVFEQRCALTHSWPGLDSFPTEELVRDLRAVSESGRELPIFFYSGEYVDLTTCRMENLEKEKEKIMAQFLRDHGYTEVLRNERYVICLPNGQSNQDIGDSVE